MKMCEKILLYAQQELSPQEQAAMQEHLQTCAVCKKQLAFLNHLDEALVAGAAPSDLVDRVFAKTTRKKAVFFSWKKIVTAAAAMLIAGVVWLDVYHIGSQPFDRQELVAYMQANLDEQYQWFEEDLAAMEEDF